METKQSLLFFSYARADAEFALKLAKSLRSAGANLWIDQLDIQAGDHWDRAVEQALTKAESLLIILSPDAVDSKNVMDEVSFALEENKRVVPVLYKPCNIPFRLRRVQHVDFTADFSQGLERLLNDLAIKGPAEKPQLEPPKTAKLSKPEMRPPEPQALLQPNTSADDLQNVLRLIGEHFDVPATDIDPNTPLSDQSVCADELDITEIILFIEEELGVNICPRKGGIGSKELERCLRPYGVDEISPAILASMVTARRMNK